MPINWKLMDSTQPGHFEGLIVSIVGGVIPYPETRDALAAFEKGGTKGRWAMIKTKFRDKARNRPGQKASVGTATVAGAAIGTGIGMVLGPLGAFVGGIIGGAVAAFAQIPVNQGIAAAFAKDYDRYSADAKNIEKHVAGYKDHMLKYEAAIRSNDPDQAGHHLYKAAHHMSKVKIVYNSLNQALTNLGNSLPSDQALSIQLIAGLNAIDRLN